MKNTKKTTIKKEIITIYNDDNEPVEAEVPANKPLSNAWLFKIKKILQKSEIKLQPYEQKAK